MIRLLLVRCRRICRLGLGGEGGGGKEEETGGKELVRSEATNIIVAGELRLLVGSLAMNSAERYSLNNLWSARPFALRSTIY